MINSTQIKAIKKLLSLIIPLLFSNISRAQNISGKVTNSSKESLIGAYITVPDINGIGTISDENGLFKLSVNSFPVTLKVAYLGYDDNLVVVKSPNLKLAIIMKESKENVLRHLKKDRIFTKSTIRRNLRMILRVLKQNQFK